MILHHVLRQFSPQGWLLVVLDFALQQRIGFEARIIATDRRNRLLAGSPCKEPVFTFWFNGAVER